MRRLVCLALALEISPLAACYALVLWHPVGDPQKSGSLIVRILDYQLTYWMRNAILLPPPLLLSGLLLSLFLWKSLRLERARVAVGLGIFLMGLWCLVMVVPLLIHVD